jgi:hypothetical protein
MIACLSLATIILLEIIKVRESILNFCSYLRGSNQICIFGYGYGENEVITVTIINGKDIIISFNLYDQLYCSF